MVLYLVAGAGPDESDGRVGVPNCRFHACLVQAAREVADCAERSPFVETGGELRRRRGSEHREQASREQKLYERESFG